jgi:hypothetical protein
MSRKPLFLAYGVVVGLLWAGVVNGAAASTFVFAAIWNIALAVFFGALGWKFAGSSKHSSKRLLILLPLIPFVPVVLLGSLFGMLAFLLLLVVAWPFLALQCLKHRRRHRTLMKSKRRFMAASDLRPKLEEGTGTLLVEHGEKGPLRLWWTDDDLSALGEPGSIKEQIEAIIQGKEHTFNRRCEMEYLCAANGKAILTSIPPHWAKSERLARTFPRMRIVAVVRFHVPGQKEETNDAGQDDESG